MPFESLSLINVANKLLSKIIEILDRNLRNDAKILEVISQYEMFESDSK